MEWSCPWSFATSAGTISFNTGTTDDYVLDPDRCDGDMPEVRTIVDPSPRTHGAILHPGYLGQWTFVMGGVMKCGTGTAAARNTMHDNLRDAIIAAVTAAGTLTQTPSGGSARSVSAQTEVRLATSSWQQGIGGWVKAFVFSLVTGDTDWS